MAQNNVGSIESLKNSVGGNVQTLKTNSESLEERVAALEQRLTLLNQACFVGDINQNSISQGQNSQGQANPGLTVAPPSGGSFFRSGGRRLAEQALADDCFPAKVEASAAGLISVAASTVATLFLCA